MASAAVGLEQIKAAAARIVGCVRKTEVIIMGMMLMMMLMMMMMLMLMMLRVLMMMVLMMLIGMLIEMRRKMAMI